MFHTAKEESKNKKGIAFFIIVARSFENRGSRRIGFDSRYTRCGELDWFNDYEICDLKLVVYFQEMFGTENLQ